MGIEKENYGVTKEGKQVTKYTLTNGQGASVSFLDYGAVIQSLSLIHIFSAGSDICSKCAKEQFCSNGDQ